MPKARNIWAPTGFQRLLLWILPLAAVCASCGDISQQSDSIGACDASYCIDCVDPCCYDLGYC